MRPRRRAAGVDRRVELPNGGSPGPGADLDAERELFGVYRDRHDRATRNEIVLRYQWVAERCANRLRDRGEPWHDLLQVALVGLVKAVERFDPARGVAFASFATPTVMGELKRHFRDATWPVSVPRRSKDLRYRMNAAIEALHQRLGRSPTVDEIAAELEVGRDAVIETMDANSVYRSLPLNAPSGADDDHTRADVFGSEDAELDMCEVRVLAVDAIRTLDERSQRLIYWRFYEELTQQEIADRLGIGQVQVSRLLRSILADLRGRMDDPEPVAGHSPATA